MASVPPEKLERDVQEDLKLALKCISSLREKNPEPLKILADVNDALVVSSTFEFGIRFMTIAAQKPNGTLKGLLFAIDDKGSIAYICQTVS